MVRHVAPRTWSMVALLALAAASPRCGTGYTPPPEPGDPVADLVLIDGPQFELGERVELDGSASALGEDADGLALTYLWRLAGKPLGSVLQDEALEPVDGAPERVAFTPDIQGIFEVTLQVSDGTRLSDVDHVYVQVGGGNACPVADAGEDRLGLVGVPVELDGGGTADADGDDDDSAGGGTTLDLRWRFALVPTASALGDGDLYYQGTDHPTFIPDVAGVYIVGLRADDGLCESEADYVQVLVTEANDPPLADAGASRLLSPCAPSRVSLDGTGSFDPEGQTLQYRWSFAAVPTGSAAADAFIDGAFTATPSFNWDVPGVYTLQLTVSDGLHDSAPAFTSVRAVPASPNTPPVAVLGDDIVVDVRGNCISSPYGGGSCTGCGTRDVPLDGGDSYDPDGDPLNFQWGILTGTGGNLLGSQSEDPVLQLPSLSVTFGQTIQRSYNLQLTVYDCSEVAYETVRVTYVCRGSI